MTQNSASRTLITGGRIYSPVQQSVSDEGRDILIEDGRIVEVGAISDRSDVDVVDATGTLVMPGFVDTHIHLWESLFRGRASENWGTEFFTNMRPLNTSLTPDDVYVATKLGALELLANGVTRVFEFCPTVHSPEHADAGIRALADTGIRAVFGFDVFGGYSDRQDGYASKRDRFDDAARLRDEWKDHSRIDVGIALSPFTATSRSETTEEVKFARSIGALMSFHQNRPGMIRMLHEWDLLGPDMVGVHGNWSTDDDFRLLAAVGGHLSVTPEAESVGGNRPMSMVSRAHAEGVSVSLGVDVPAMVSTSIIQQMRYMHLLQRILDGQNERMSGFVPVSRRPGFPTLQARDLVNFGTHHGVAALTGGTESGELVAGERADLVLLRTDDFGRAFGDPAVHVVLYSGRADLTGVMVDGRMLMRDGVLAGVDFERLGVQRDAARKRVLEASGSGSSSSNEYWDWVPESLKT